MRRVLWWFVTGIGILVIAASLMPLLETNVWWIRVLDFPRLQYLLAILVVALLILPIGSLRSGATWLVLTGLAAAAGYNIYKLHPYWSLTDRMAVELESCPEGSEVRILVANVQKGNRQAEALLGIIRETDPDMLLAMETDEWWDRQLRPLADRFAERVQHVDGGYFGMHLFSKLPLSTPAVRFLAGQDVPSVFADVTLPGGEVFRFIGIHPRPPHPFESSTGRDAQILTAALEAREGAVPAVVAGDLNAVPWERVVRRAMRIGGLLDPRAGRTFLPTYDAQQAYMRWPLDQVLFQDGFGLVAMERLPEFGSDHYPFLVTLCLSPDLRERQSAPSMTADDLDEAERSIQAALDDAGRAGRR